jgi:hypothetical protein
LLSHVRASSALVVLLWLTSLTAYNTVSGPTSDGTDPIAKRAEAANTPTQVEGTEKFAIHGLMGYTPPPPSSMSYCMFGNDTEYLCRPSAHCKVNLNSEIFKTTTLTGVRKKSNRIHSPTKRVVTEELEEGSNVTDKTLG